jgi:Zn-dependent protease with chaperone function
MRALRELLGLLALFVVVAALVFGIWHWRQRGRPAATSEKSTLVRRGEEKIRDLIRHEARLEAVSAPDTVAGLRTIEARLAPALGTLEFPLEVHVIDSPTVNAACLPGNVVLVYAGLLRRLDTPEELTAVIAHEAAHAKHRDPMEALKRELGIGAIFAFAGGRADTITSRVVRRLISSGFSRKQEEDADAEALRMLAASDIDPGSFGQALRKIRESNDGDPTVLQYLSTHPDVDARIKAAETASHEWHGKVRPVDLDWKKFRAPLRLLP